MAVLQCKDLPDVASDFISRTGPLRTQLMTAVHLAQCKNCRTYVHGLKITANLVRASLRRPVADEVFQALGLNDPDRKTSFKEPRE